MRGFGNLVGGGGGGGSRSNSKKVNSDALFLVFNLFYRSPMVISKKTIMFPGSGGGPTFSRGSNFFREGVQLLNPYRNPYNL